MPEACGSLGGSMLMTVSQTSALRAAGITRLASRSVETIAAAAPAWSRM